MIPTTKLGAIVWMIVLILGFIGLVRAVWNSGSIGEFFMVLVPYIAVAGNHFLVVTSPFNSTAVMAVYGYFITIPIATVSFFLGGIIGTFEDRYQAKKENSTSDKHNQ